MARQREFVMTRVLRNGEKDDGRFDLEFWGKVGPEGIWAAAWELVGELHTMRGDENASERRLQRSVCRLVRSGG